MGASRQALGRWGERLAAQYLQAQGYTILDQNVYTPYGEIDLVTRQVSGTEASKRSLDGDASAATKGMLVFVEVKTRSSTAYGEPEDAITLRKRDHMLNSAQAYLQSHPEFDGDWRIDVISIRRFKSDSPPEILHFENAIT